MTSSTALDTKAESEGSEQLSEKFIECLQTQAGEIAEKFPNINPMEAHACALIFVDTLAKLHEAGLEESVKAGDARQAGSWTRDLTIFETVISLLRNIQPLDIDAT